MKKGNGIIETDNDVMQVPARRGWLALSPVVVFPLLYMAVSIILDDFYKMPVSVALMLSSMWAIVIYRGRPLLQRIEDFSRSAGHANILYMIWVFILAGAFAAIAKESGSVMATVNLALRVFPPAFVVPMVFFAACFISLSIGTSVGTVVALTPLAVEIAETAGGSVPFFVAVVLGGAFFGDNLSFISDTTIAATRSQGCDMSDKFKANLWIALPAAVITLMLYVILGAEVNDNVVLPSDTDWWLILPYLTVIVTAVMGINVTIVLTLGIICSVVMGLMQGFTLVDLASFAGDGIAGIVKRAGGIAFILQGLTRRIHGCRGAQSIIAILVAIVNLCTANNTVAIITVGSISRDISRRYGIDPRKAASLLDSTSCIVQCLIPYGAQTLLASGMAGISPGAPFPYLYYPWALGVMVILSIIFLFPKKLN